MKKRLIKALSIPTAMIILIPFIILFSIVWIIKGKYNPMELIDKYLTWLIIKN